MIEHFKNKTPNFKKLLSFGFQENTNFLEYTKNILDNEFCINIKIFKNGEIKTQIIEISTREIYTLHLVDGAKGSFVGLVKQEYENILQNIADFCFDTDVFVSDMTKKIIKYVIEKYCDKPEYLWEKFPKNAVFRRKDNKKWYAAILTVQRNRFGFDSDEFVEVIDLRAKKEDVPQLIKQKNIYPGWHMNKKSWITIILDKSMAFDEICSYIETSYTLAK